MHSAKALALLAAAVVAGCAASPEKSAAPAPKPEDLQLVRIETRSGDFTVTGARCGVRNDRSRHEVVPPAVIEVRRSAKPLEISCFLDGYRMAILTIESGGSLAGSAATGAVVGGAVSAVAALPLLAIPFAGPFLYAGTVGGTALLGGTLNAVDDHSKARVYAYPTAIVVKLVPREPPAGFHVAQPAALPSAAPMALPTPPTLANASPLPTPPGSPPAAPLSPVAQETPLFPEEALKAGVAAGRVLARLDIDGAGGVTAVHIVEAQPQRVFDRAVIDALGRWRFGAGAAGRNFEAEVEFRR